ncbi:MAG: DNA helicase UvrD, partial [Actinobacteria bacterium]
MRVLPGATVLRGGAMSFPLDDEQRAAVEALEGRVLIVAGAGSGKTRTLTERFAAGLDDHSNENWSAAGVDEVLAITFTDKAAGELAARVRRALYQAGRVDDARAIDGAWVSTIHGLCSRILRRHALEAGIDPSFRVANRIEAARLERDAFDEACLWHRERDAFGLLGEYGIDAVFG